MREKELVLRETHPKRGNYLWVREPTEYPSLEPVPLDRIQEGRYSGVLSLVLTTLQPLHIGSGKLTPRNRNLLQEFYHHGGHPVLPGSSLKGVIRHHLVTLLGGSQTKALFGTTSHASRVLFSDAIPEKPTSPRPGEIPERWGPRHSPPEGFTAKYYPKDPRPQDLQHRRERLEVVPKDTRFHFTIVFRNFSAYELGALLVALGLDPRYRRGFKLGGGKGYGLGLVRVELQHERSWWIRNARDLLKSPDQRPRVTDDEIRKWTEKFWNSLPKQTRDHLQQIEEVFRREYHK